MLLNARLSALCRRLTKVLAQLDSVSLYGACVWTNTDDVSLGVTIIAITSISPLPLLRKYRLHPQRPEDTFQKMPLQQ